MSDVKTTALALQKAVNDAKSVAELQAIVTKYYGANCRQSEAGQPWKEGFQTIYDAESGFFNYLEKGHVEHNTVKSIAVDGNKAFIEVNVGFVLKGNPTPIVTDQLVEQEWKDGKLVLERFWHVKK